MLSLKIPKSILWSALAGALLLLLMMAYRLITQPIFSPDLEPVSLGRVLWLGFRYDLRYVSALVLAVVVMGLIPDFHVYRSHLGRNIALVLFTLFAGLLFFLYGADLAYQISFNQRLSLGIFEEWRRNTPAAIAYRNNSPWIIIFLVMGVATWLVYLFIRYSHRWIGKWKHADDRMLRIFWQVLVVVVLSFCIYGRPGSEALSIRNAKALHNEAATNAALNPFESVRASMAEKK
jgi:hypothetical protein